MVIATVSLLAAQWGASRYPEATFFLLPTRAWELAIGAGIAFYFLYRPHAIHTLPFRKPYNEILGLLGTRFLVGIGLISDSAYLWHYPLIAFARHRSLT